MAGLIPSPVDVQAGAEKGGLRAAAEEAQEGGPKKRRKRIDPASLGGDSGGYANYLGSLFNGGDVGAAFLQQYMQLAESRRPDEGAVWSSIMSIVSTCMAGPSPPEDGSEPPAQPVTRLIALVPHVGIRAMGIIWEEDAEGQGEGMQVVAAVWQNGTMLMKELCANEVAAREHLAGMIALLVSVGPQNGAGSSAPAPGASLPGGGGFPPLATLEQQQQQQFADLMGAGVKMQEQQQQQQLMGGMAELLAAAQSGGPGAEALTSAINALMSDSSGAAGGADISAIMAQAIAAYGGAGGMDIMSMMAAAGGGGEEQQSEAHQADQAPADVQPSMEQQGQGGDSVAGQDQGGGAAGSLPLFRAP